ncbi:MAG: hypothetical protein HOW73_00055 [Polyangiaceae bacterium]|nr:hypothetical protein [Polyangiaceae bacterium]
MIKRKVDETSWLYFDQRGSLVTLEWGEGLITFVCRGVQLTEFAPYVIEHGEQQIRKFGRCIYMVDAWDSNQMTTDFREQMTGWLARHPNEVEAHLLVRSKLLQMAVNVTNLVLGKAMTKAYADIAGWEAAGRRFVGRFHRRVPALPADLRESPTG